MLRDLRLLHQNGAASGLHLWENQFSSLMTQLNEFCRISSDQLLEEELLFYSRHRQKDLQKWFEEKRDMQNKADSNIFLLPIGWGSGYDAKTIADLLSPTTFKAITTTYRNTKGLGYPGRNMDRQWLGPLDAPKSRKVAIRSIHNDIQLEPMGWVKIQVNDVNSPEIQQEWESLRNKSQLPKRNYKAPILTESPRLKEEVEEIHKPKLEPSFVISFDSIPEVGKQFIGTIFAIDQKGIYLEIPGLSADEVAFGWISIDDRNPKLKEDQSIHCQVSEITTDPLQPEVKKVICFIID
jgi:hypothetical protein